MSTGMVSNWHWRLTAHAHIDGRFIVFDATQNFKPAQLPLSAFRRVYRSHFEVSVDRRRIGINKLDGSLSSR